MDNVTVIGAGAFGTSLAIYSQSLGHKVNVWTFEKDLPDIIKKDGENTVYLPGIKIKPEIKVIGVQTDTSPVMSESLRAGELVTMEIQDTIADGLAGLIESGSVSFDLVKKYVDDIMLVSEEETRKAVVHFLEKQHQVIEGAAAVIPAAFLKYRNLFKGKKAVGVLTGRNISFELLKELIESVII